MAVSSTAMPAVQSLRDILVGFGEHAVQPPAIEGRSEALSAHEKKVQRSTGAGVRWSTS